MVSVWDIKVPEEYQSSVDAMAQLVKSHEIDNVYRHFEKEVGTDHSLQLLDDESVKKWDHFHFDLPDIYVDAAPGTKLGELKATKEVFKRGLEELTLDSAEIVLDQIEAKVLLRGDEYKRKVVEFVKQLKAYNKIKKIRKDNYCWKQSSKLGISARFRGTVIGTLLVDIAEGTKLEVAIDKYNLKTDPNNFKRCTSAVTTKMTKDAEKTASDLGIIPALSRRCAVTSDVTVDNVIYADKAVRKAMSAFDLVMDTTLDKKPDLTNALQMSIWTFLEDIVPNATNIQVLLENKHTNSLMTLVAPVHPMAPNILSWGNNFSWAYNGDITDSMKERVKVAGGRVDGAFRFTHSWNEIEPNQSLMDLHVFMPGNTHSYPNTRHDQYGNRNSERVGWNHMKHVMSGGVQDVDYVDQAPKDFIPIENITFPNIDRMPEGDYLCKVHNWSYRQSGGRGKAEIEFGGNIYQYEYPATRHHQWISVAKVNLKNKEFTIEHLLPHGESTTTVWGINSQKFHRVNMIMNSPNHWNGEKSGNKHLFFILDKCKNPDPVRGFFPEFLMADLHKHRKVFEILGSKMKAEPTDDQLSGLGFSSSKVNQIVVKVETSTGTRTYEVNL